MTADKQVTFEKLPTTARPTNYKIDLAPNLETLAVEGSVKIKLNILETVKELKLNALDLTFKEVSLTVGGATLSNLETVIDNASEKVTVKLGRDVAPTTDAELVLKYSSRLQESSMKGFYLSTYKDPDGTTRNIASTQFESTYARYAFPCWDEPEYKATFDVTLTVDSNLTALSNMNALTETDAGDGRKTIVYAPTPLMSTYLVAFAVGRFDFLETTTNRDVKVRVYSVPHKVEQCKFALEVAKKALEFYDQFFDIPYMLPKCDLIAIPDFSMGAMENFGLVTYREVVLLLDPAKTSSRIRAHIALVVGHELAHMWFGNLVTMKWWTDLWLKEGFASFMEFVFVAAEYPEFDIWTQFVNDEVARGLELDGLRNSHPIEIPIDNPNELEEIYDAITYAKGNSVTRMLYFFLGRETFQKAVQAYLKQFSYSNAVTADLWAALSTASGENVGALMNSWTSQMGFPLVSVAEEVDADGTRALVLSQQRFLADGGQDDKGYKWQVPVNVITSSSPNEPKFKSLLKETEARVQLVGVGKDEWVKVNGGMTGFYRVSYSQPLFDKLMGAFDELSTIDRFNIISDLAAIMTAGGVPAARFLDVLLQCPEENEYIVWAEIDSAVGLIGNALGRREDTRARFDAFVRDVYAPIVERVGWQPKPGETHHQQLLRPRVLGRIGRAGHEPTLNEARRLFAEHVDKGTELVPDMRATIFRLNAFFGGTAAQEKLKDVFGKSDHAEVQRAALAAIGASVDPQVLVEALNWAYFSGSVKLQDLAAFINGAGVGPQAQDALWQFFKDNFAKILKQCGGTANQIQFQYAFKLSAHNQCSREVAKEVEEFFVGGEHAHTMSRPAKQTAEHIRLSADLMQRDGDKLDAWLRERRY